MDATLAAMGNSVMDEAEWKKAYSDEFRDFALSRNWCEECISDWLSDILDDAWLYCGTEEGSPSVCAKEDVVGIEQDAASV